MRLGFHYHIPAFRDHTGAIRVPGYLGRFLDSLAVHCESLICFLHSPRSDELAQMDYPLQSPNITWVDIGPHVSILQRMLKSRTIVRAISEHRDKLDVLLIRGPSPLLPSVAKAAGDLPVALLLVGDYLAGVNDLPQPRWRKEAIRAWSYWNFRQQLTVARRSLTFVNSHKLFEQLSPHVPRLIETRTTTLTEDDFFEREDTCQGRPIRLLYTGRMDRAKGLFEIVAAVDLLRQRGHDVVLDLVGWPQKGDTIVEELLHDAEKRGIHDHIYYHGFKAVGPELFAYYRQADIYVIASQSSEGFPRTIWEAMAHSLPVVATRVGSIPDYLEHQTHALLVSPRQPRALADAVTTVVENPTKRRKLIRSARLAANEVTLDRLSEGLVQNIIEFAKAYGVQR